MSDTDDTDLLLIIPPDFFNVQSSDSEDSNLDFRRTLRDNSQHIVNNLITHVNQLEARVCTIESKENLLSESRGLDCSVAVNSIDHGDVALSFYAMTSAGCRFGSSLDCNRNALYTSLQLRPQSLPPTPSVHSENVQALSDTLGLTHLKFSHGPKDIQSYPDKLVHENSIKSGMSHGAKLTKSDSVLSLESNSSDSYPAFSEPDDRRTMSYQDISFLSEIDEFLESKRKMSQKMDVPHNVDINCKSKKNNINCNKKSNGNSLDNHTSLSTEISHTDRGTIIPDCKRLTLPEVDKILSEMEKTQSQIEKKLNTTVLPNHSTAKLSYQFHKPQLEYFESKKQHVPESEIQKCVVNAQTTNAQRGMTDRDEPVQHGPRHERKHLESDHIEEVAVCKKLSMSGDTIGSVPDLGYGIRSIIMQPAVDAQSNAMTQKGEDVVCGSTVMPQISLNTNVEAEHTDSPRQTVASDEVKSSFPHTSEKTFAAPSLQCPPLQRPHYSLTHDSIHHVSAQPASMYVHNKVENDIHGNSLKDKHLWQPFINVLSNNDLPERDVPETNRKYLATGDTVKQPLELSVGKRCDQVNMELLHAGRHPTGVIRMDQIPNYKSVLNSCSHSEKIPQKRVEFSGESFSNLEKPTSREIAPHVPATFNVKSNVQNDNVSTSSTVLLSLSELWGSDSSGNKQRVSSVEQRLEEETYRRKHCERLVQELQRQLLEEREKLAVAMRVDESKDHAISQLQIAWDKLVGHWHDLEEERNGLAQQLHDDKVAVAREISEWQEKVKQAERELSRALELAQGYQTRCAEMENEVVKMKNNSETALAACEERITILNNDVAHITSERDQLLKHVSDIEEAITKDKNILKEAEAEIKKMNEVTKNQEAEIHSLKQQKETIQMRLNETNKKNHLLENSKAAIQDALEESRKKEREAQAELKASMEEMKQEKIKLRDMYQQQVERLVHEKVQEFQSQLDTAEAALEQREKTLAEMTSQQIKLLTEKYQMEVKLLEEKQHDEMKLYQIQLAQANQQLAKLQAQLQLQVKHRNEVLEHLHDAMEAQWQEALRMVQGKGDIWSAGDFQFNESKKKIDVKSHFTKDSPTSSAEITANNKYQFAKMLDTAKHAAAFQESYHADIPPLALPPSSTASTAGDDPFSREDQLTYRVQEEKPLSVSPGQELKKYIQQLLARAPGDPLQEAAPVSAVKDAEKESKRTLPIWEPVCSDQVSVSSTSTSQMSIPSRAPCEGDRMIRNSKSGKPPWK